MSKKQIIDLYIDKQTDKIVFFWLLLAIVSLIFAGIFAFLIAMARTPHVQDILPGTDFFRVALVAHVVLSIVIWFMTFKGILWAITSTGYSKRSCYSSRLALSGIGVSALGTLFLILPAFLGLGHPLFINYIPILDHWLYYLGLFLFAVGIVIFLVNVLVTYYSALREGDSLFVAEKYGMLIAALAIVIALLCYGLAFFTFPDNLKKFVYLEHFFWGGGHILQFGHTIGMLVAWILLVKLTLNISPISNNWAIFSFTLYVPFILAAPAVFIYYTGGEEGFKLAFTQIMQYGYGTPTIIIGFAVLLSIIKNYRTSINSIVHKELPWKDPGFSSLVFSIILFASGGMVAIFIQGSNTKIPSHYHGVIGAVTIAFMGLTYHILPMMGRKIHLPRMAQIQPYLYGIGQLLFVIGMFWAGSHGVARKTYGSAQGLDNIAKLAGMMLMGIGGLVAIAGGGTFVYNVLLSLFKKKG